MGKVRRERALMLGLGKFFEGVTERQKLEDELGIKRYERERKEKEEEEDKKYKEFDRLRQLEKDELNLKIIQAGQGRLDEFGNVVPLARPVKTTKEQENLKALRERFFPSKPSPKEEKQQLTPEQRGFETEDEFLDKVIGKDKKEEIDAIERQRTAPSPLPPLPGEELPPYFAGVQREAEEAPFEAVSLGVPSITPSVAKEDEEEGLGFKSVVSSPYIASEEEIRRLGMDEVRRKASGRSLQVILEDKTVPSYVSTNLDTLRDMREAMQLASGSVLRDLERQSRGEPSRLIMGVKRITNYSDLIRKGITTTENQEFHGYIVRAQSAFLTDATGAQRGMQEMGFLFPATITSKDSEKSVLYKTAQNIIYSGINLQRMKRILDAQRLGVAMLPGDTLFETEQVLNTIEHLDNKGVDTQLLKRHLKDWWADEKFDVRTVDTSQLDTASVRSVLPMLSPEERVIFMKRIERGK